MIRLILFLTLVFTVKAQAEDPFSRCRNEETFEITLPENGGPIPPPPAEPPVTRFEVFRTEIPNAVGAVEICAMREPPTIPFPYSDVLVRLERGGRLTRIRKGDCGIFAGRVIEVQAGASSTGLARVCLIELRVGPS